MRSSGTRHARRVVLAVALMLGAGCSSEQTDPTPEPEFTTVVLELNQAIEFEADREVGFGNPTITVESGTVLISSVEFLLEDGTPDPAINELDFRIVVAGSATGEPLPEEVTFARTGSFTGTIGGIAQGQTFQVFISLHHSPPNHDDFGPFPITITRPQDDGGGGPPPAP